jgi:hypothetical protein
MHLPQSWSRHSPVITQRCRKAWRECTAIRQYQYHRRTTQRIPHYFQFARWVVCEVRTDHTLAEFMRISIFEGWEAGSRRYVTAEDRVRSRGLVEWYWQGKIPSDRTETCPTDTSSTTEATRTALRSNPGRCGATVAGNCMSHCTAFCPPSAFACFVWFPARGGNYSYTASTIWSFLMDTISFRRCMKYIFIYYMDFQVSSG